MTAISKQVFTTSEEEFREVVCTITGLQKNDPVFDAIREQDKRLIKSSKTALDFTRRFEQSSTKKIPELSPSAIRKTKGGVFNLADIPVTNG